MRRRQARRFERRLPGPDVRALLGDRVDRPLRAVRAGGGKRPLHVRPMRIASVGGPVRRRPRAFVVGPRHVHALRLARIARPVGSRPFRRLRCLPHARRLPLPVTGRHFRAFGRAPPVRVRHVQELLVARRARPYAPRHLARTQHVVHAHGVRQARIRRPFGPRHVERRRHVLHVRILLFAQRTRPVRARHIQRRLHARHVQRLQLLGIDRPVGARRLQRRRHARHVRLLREPAEARCSDDARRARGGRQPNALLLPVPRLGRPFLDRPGRRERGGGHDRRLRRPSGRDGRRDRARDLGGRGAQGVQDRLRRVLGVRRFAAVL